MFWKLVIIVEARWGVHGDSLYILSIFMYLWRFRSMNQGKLEVIKQEMARVNINILGISELKWTGMGKFNSDDHYIYYCGQESLRRNGVALIVNKRVWNAVLGCNLKNKRMISVHFQGKLAVQGTFKSLPQHHSSKASVLQCSAFFHNFLGCEHVRRWFGCEVQLSLPYMSTG